MSGIGEEPATGQEARAAAEAFLEGRVENRGGEDLQELFTHYGLDRHPDHRVVSELTWNTFRNHLVAELEMPKYEGDLERPNIYVTAKAFFMVL